MIELTEREKQIVLDACKQAVVPLWADIYQVEKMDLAGASGTNNFDFPRIREGDLVVVTFLVAYDDTSSPTRIRLGYWNGHRFAYLKTAPAPLATETVLFTGVLLLAYGHYLRVTFEGVTSGDDLYAFASGYYLKH